MAGREKGPKDTGKLGVRAPLPPFHCDYGLVFQAQHGHNRWQNARVAEVPRDQAADGRERGRERGEERQETQEQRRTNGAERSSK